MSSHYMTEIKEKGKEREETEIDKDGAGWKRNNYREHKKKV